MGVMKLDLIGQEVEVEYRSGIGLYFVVYPKLIACQRPPLDYVGGFELVMAFEERLAAGEIAINTRRGTPFFSSIPVVPHLTPYPRPWLTYPKDDGYRLELRMR